jgi:hypothetical protein
MKLEDTVWQGHFGHWQTLFIHQNLLTIGYTAWNGYLQSGRGLVICELETLSTMAIDWSIETIPFRRSFLPQEHIPSLLESLSLDDGSEMLLAAIATYDPTQSILLLVLGNGEAHFNLLQSLTIPPASCYAQVQQRWAEFQLNLVS